MKRFMFLLWFSVCSPAAADTPSDTLADNPAFCFGFLSAWSSADAERLDERLSQIIALHARTGPKDSTDERDFDDWQMIGQEAAADRTDAKNPARLKNCRRLTGFGPS